MLNSHNLIPVINRSVMTVQGQDRYQFLQDLITNDINLLHEKSAIYGLLLSPQGRFLHDFIITQHQDYLRLEIEINRTADLMKRLNMYKLRSKVTIDDTADHYRIYAWMGSIDALPEALHAHAYRDPRFDKLGYRLVIPTDLQVALAGNFIDYDSHRLVLGIPDGSRDMKVDKAIPLEFGMDHLHAISWDKGCYLGQELTARTKHRGIVRKGIFPAQFEGLPPEYGAQITTQTQGIDIGQTLSHCQNTVLCRLRTDHITDIFDGNQILHYPGGILRPARPLWSL